MLHDAKRTPGLAARCARPVPTCAYRVSPGPLRIVKCARSQRRSPSDRMSCMWRSNGGESLLLTQHCAAVRAPRSFAQANASRDRRRPWRSEGGTARAAVVLPIVFAPYGIEVGPLTSPIVNDDVVIETRRIARIFVGMRQVRKKRN